MKRHFKHKITGDIVSLLEEHPHLSTKYGNGVHIIPRLFVENGSDWEEIPELNVPIGTKFKFRSYETIETIYTINSITKNNEVLVTWEGIYFNHTYYTISQINKYFKDGTWKIYEEPKVLFITKDGVEIYPNMTVYLIDKDFTYRKLVNASKPREGDNRLYFSSEVKVKEYIELNKPVFSISKMLDFLEGDSKLGFSSKWIYNETTAFVVEKLKQYINNNRS